MAEAQQPIAMHFAEWVTTLKYDDLSPAVIEQAKQAFADTVSLMVMGSGVERVAPFRALATSDPHGGASIVGESDRFRPRDAAFVNAIFAHSSELDDIFLQAGGHPGVATAPAALAVAERNGLSGRDLIVAISAGYEIMHRSINPIFPYTQRRGFQGTGLAGPFGSTAAVGSLLRVDAATLGNALGIAGCYSSGLMEYDQSGGESKRLYAGLAARAGIESVDLALAGVTGPLTIYEGKRGVFNAFSDERHVELATQGLGTEEFRIATRRHVKPYPVVASIHGALDALETLVPGVIAAEDVTHVRVILPPLALTHGGAIGVPTDTLSAQFSFAFSIAVRLLTGAVDTRWFEDEVFRNSTEVASVCAKVSLEADPELEANAQQGGATVEITFADGRTARSSNPIPVGRPDNPLSAAQRRARFVRFTEPALGAGGSAQLWSLFEGLESVDAVEITRLLSEQGNGKRDRQTS